jgi:hypothetical protein
MNKAAHLIALAALLVGCSDGGSSGTGITTASGNVSSVTSGLTARSGPVPGIRVTIANTTIASATDASGRFSLAGDFAGPVSMTFGLSDGSSASLVVTVPRGGEVALRDVSVDAVTGQATAKAQTVRFDGLVEGTTCSSQQALMVSRHTPNDGNEYTVDLRTASVRSAAGSPLGCQNLSVGDAVDVRGAVGQQGEVEAESVDVENEFHDGGGDGEGGGSNSGSASGDEGRSGGEGHGGSSTSGENGGTSGEDGGTSGENGGSSGGEGGTSGSHSGGESGGSSGGGSGTD